LTEAMFLYFSAPILRRIKPVVLIPVHSHCYETWMECQHFSREVTGLSTIEIRKRNGTILLMIYDKSVLSSHLYNPKSSEILKQYGYPADCELEEALKILENHFLLPCFPHEIGIFLGYPPKDVQSFITNNGKNCMFCRHWKMEPDGDGNLIPGHTAPFTRVGNSEINIENLPLTLNNEFIGKWESNIPSAGVKLTFDYKTNGTFDYEMDGVSAEQGGIGTGCYVVYGDKQVSYLEFDGLASYEFEVSDNDNIINVTELLPNENGELISGNTAPFVRVK